MSYSIKIYKSVVKDNFLKGNHGDHILIGEVATFHARALKDALEQCEDFAGGKIYVDLEGHATIDAIENDQGTEPTSEELKAWHEGEIDLWSAMYDLVITKNYEVRITKNYEVKIDDNFEEVGK